MSDEEIEDRGIIRLLRSESKADVDPGTELLIKKYDKTIKAAIYRNSQFLDHALRDDIYQEVLINLLHSIKSDKLRDEGNLPAFVTIIAKRRTIDFVRKEHRRKESSTGEEINELIFERLFARPIHVQ